MKATNTAASQGQRNDSVKPIELASDAFQSERETGAFYTIFALSVMLSGVIACIVLVSNCRITDYFGETTTSEGMLVWAIGALISGLCLGMILLDQIFAHDVVITRLGTFTMGNTWSFVAFWHYICFVISVIFVFIGIHNGSDGEIGAGIGMAWFSLGFARFCRIFSDNSAALRLLKHMNVSMEMSTCDVENTSCDVENTYRKALESLPSSMVEISGRCFKICKNEVTQALWVGIMGSNPSKFRGDDRPVESVSWHDVQTFIRNLNSMPIVKEAGVVYRLPTEEEWEYACRTGSLGEYGNPSEGNEGNLNEMGWYDNNSGGHTHPVGQKKPNAYGLYDMYGNVWEWTSTIVDGNLRVICGGGWDSSAIQCKLVEYDGVYEKERLDNLGFRLVQENNETVGAQ